MHSLLGTQILAIVVPFIAPFIFEGVQSWLGWIIVILLLSLILVPSIGIPMIAKSNSKEPSESFEILCISEAVLLGLYFIFWIVGIVFAFSRYQCQNCALLRKY